MGNGSRPAWAATAASAGHMSRDRDREHGLAARQVDRSCREESVQGWRQSGKQPVTNCQLRWRLVRGGLVHNPVVHSSSCICAKGGRHRVSLVATAIANAESRAALLRLAEEQTASRAERRRIRSSRRSLRRSGSCFRWTWPACAATSPLAPRLAPREFRRQHPIACNEICGSTGPAAAQTEPELSMMMVW